MNKKYFLFILIIVFLHFSCSKTKQGDLLEIPVDIYPKTLLPLSEIVEDITNIELEMTDESLINPDYIDRIIYLGSNIIVAGLNKILVFNGEGKFVRSIGSRGQGPGEYNSIQKIAIDEKNNHLYLVTNSPKKIICYDFTGKFLKESVNPILGYIVDANFINGELLVIDSKIDKVDEVGIYTRSMINRFSDDLQLIDSCIFRKNINNPTSPISYFKPDFILKSRGIVNVYCSELYMEEYAPREIVLRDTLYRIEKNKLIPELKLKFKNDGISGGNKFIDPSNIYRSSRYVFSIYENYTDKNRYYFCYDTKTRKGYNMQDGYIDDINKIDKPVKIRPFNHDTEMFYYLHTHMKPGDLEEPNPTLYIGKLKK